MYKKGFTLIETLVYLALYSVLIGGVTVAAYALFEASGRADTKAMVAEEGQYVAAKIDWALMGASAVSTPSQTQLVIINSNIPASQNPLVFDVQNGNLRLARGTAAPQVLNNSNITVSDVAFAHTTGSGDGVVPESIDASFTLNATTPGGLPYSQKFTTLQYLRK